MAGLEGSDKLDVTLKFAETKLVESRIMFVQLSNVFKAH